MSRNVTHQQKPCRSYAATSATRHVSSPAKESAEEEFIVVSRKRDRAPNQVTIANAIPHKKQRTPTLGVRNASALTVIAKKAKTMSLFVSRFSPDVTAQDIKSSLEEQLELSYLTCTRLKTKFNTYASFHVSAIEKDFPLINNTGVWPNGCLIAPFYGRLNANQMYSPDAPAPNLQNVAQGGSACTS
jgi:hypothetical protein